MVTAIVVLETVVMVTTISSTRNSSNGNRAIVVLETVVMVTGQ